MDPFDYGYLLIADITGYTRFLKDSELEHARGAKPLAPRIVQQAVLRFKMRNVGKWAHNFWVQSLANMIEIAKRDAAKGLVVTMVSPPTQQDIRSAVDSCLAEF